MRVGIIGCGNISGVYVRNAKLFNDIEISACSDIVQRPAKRLAHKYCLREMNDPVAEVRSGLCAESAARD
jgi:predicted dehydrogenase